MRDIDTLAGQVIHLRQNVELKVCYTPGQAPALVFLHGTLGNRFNWRSQYEFAQARGWEALAYDLAGHGQSSSHQHYSLGRHRRDLTRLLRYFNMQFLVLCCHSYGVPLGLEWARRHPVTALIAIGGGTHNLTPWWEVPLIKFLAGGGRQLYRFPGIQKLTNALSSSHRHPVIEQFFAESSLPIGLHPYQALEIFWGYNFLARGPTYLDLNIPVLVITGGKDPMFTPQMGAELASYFPRGQHLNLDNAGHLVMAEYPEVINQAFADLLQKLQTQTWPD